MKFILSLVVVVFTLFVNYSEATNSTDEPPGKAFYEALPSEEKKDFLVFSLGHGYTKKATKLQRKKMPDFRFPDSLGISEEHLKKFEELLYPEDFTSNLYTWIRARYNFDESKMRTLILQRMVCLENGSCIDIEDVGDLCCPF